MATIPNNSGFSVVYGSGSGTNGNRIQVWAEYKLGSQNVLANTTAITVYFYAALKSGFTSSTQNTTGLNSALQVDGIAGTGVTNGSYDFTSTGNLHTLGSFQGNIPHQTDGTKKLQITGSFTTKSSFISGGSIRFTLTLPAIARASSVGATDADIGKTAMIAIGSKNSSYTHSLAFSFGNLQGYLDADGNIQAQACKLTGTAVAFFIPESFYQEIPNAPTGICQLTCTTYAGSTQIGQPQTGAFTVSAADAKPTVSGSVTDICEATLSLTGDDKRLVRYHSTAQCLLQASAQKGASVVHTAINGISGNTLDILGFDGNAPVFTVKDSRGFSVSSTCPVDLIAYTHLTANPTIARDGPTADTATVQLSGNFFAGNFGQEENALTVTYQVNGGLWQTVDAPITAENGRYFCNFSVSELPYTANQKVLVQVSDKLETVSRELTVHKGTPVFDWGEQDFAFHVPVSCSSINGLYFDTVRVWQTNQFTLRSRYDAPGESGSREAIFLFGNDNSIAISGVLTIQSSGKVQWTGTENVTVSNMDETGRFTVTLPTTAYDILMMISTARIRKG